MPPPTIAIGEWPKRCSRASAITGSSDADVQARRRRIEADVRRHALRVANRSGEPVGRVVTPGRATPVRRRDSWHRSSATGYYTSRWRSARRARPARRCVATGVGAVAGGGAYGYLYERHALAVDARDVPVVGLPPALAGLRIGLLTDVHRSRWVSHEDVGARGHAADGASSPI